MAAIYKNLISAFKTDNRICSYNQYLCRSFYVYRKLHVMERK